MSLESLAARVADLQQQIQPAPPPSDPVVLSSVLATALAGKATPADINAATLALKDFLTNGAGTALDQFNELAAALGNDPNFAATVMTALGNRQPLSSTLTALAVLNTTAFGRSLLTLASLGAATVTPSGGTQTTLGAILVPLDPTAPGFQAAQVALLKALKTVLPQYTGTGPAPVAAGEPFYNADSGMIQFAQ